MRIFDPPVAFVRAKGAYAWDPEGRHYVDYHAAFGPIILGHGDERVLNAAFHAASTLDISGVGPTPAEVLAAEAISRHVPSAESVLFCNSGSEATYHAIRLARVHTGRRLVVKFQGCYHGWHDYVAANVISAPENLGRLDPISAGISNAALGELLVLPYNDVDAFRDLMQRRGEEIAAVIVEPVLHTIGCVPGSKLFLSSLRRLTDQYASVLIFDEVVTGFRHSLGGYQAIAGIVPDITTLGKAIANGFPVAVVAGRHALMSGFSTAGGPVMYGGTFNGNPIVTSAISATIAALEEDSGAIYRHFDVLAARMTDGLAEIGARLGLPTRPVSLGSVFVCYFTDTDVLSFDDALKNDEWLYTSFHRGMIELGHFMIPLNLKRNHFMAAHTADDVDRSLEAASQVLGKLARTRPAASYSKALKADGGTN